MSATKLPALKTVKTFNDLAARAAAKGSETLSLIWKAGETALEAKQSLPHGEWIPFVNQHYDVSHKTVTTWIRFRENVTEAKLGVAPNMSAALKMIEPPKAKSKGKGRTDSATRAQDSDPQPPRNGTDEPGDTGDEWAEDSPPEDPIDAQRSKTILAVADLMAEFNVMNDLLAKPTYDSAMKLLDATLKIAKAWK